jgi:hypothetical protein
MLAIMPIPRRALHGADTIVQVAFMTKRQSVKAFENRIDIVCSEETACT